MQTNLCFSWGSCSNVRKKVKVIYEYIYILVIYVIYTIQILFLLIFLFHLKCDEHVKKKSYFLYSFLAWKFFCISSFLFIIFVVNIIKTPIQYYKMNAILCYSIILTISRATHSWVAFSSLF